MISIVDNTTEQVSKLGVSFQLDFYLNKQAKLVCTTSTIYMSQ